MDYLVHLRGVSLAEIWTGRSTLGQTRFNAARTRTARRGATRERILTSAIALIAERGVAGTSLDDAGERAQASKSQLYLYFADRDALLRGLATTACSIKRLPFSRRNRYCALRRLRISPWERDALYPLSTRR
jgi:AcrR family transcriptional regulator